MAESTEHIAVDCGKYNTKVAYYDKKRESVGELKFRTKFMEGIFEDDMFDSGTFIAQVDDGKIYKIGSSARVEPNLETSKMSEIHQVCSLVGIAYAMLKMGVKDASVAAVIGMPLQDAYIPEKRLAYKDYILGKDDAEHTVTLKLTASGKPETVRFKVAKRLVYPESIGVLYRFPEELKHTSAILDIGNLNTNNTYADHFQLVEDKCFTTELGGKILISNLASLLSAELSRVDDNLVASTLLRPYEKRCLYPANGDTKIAVKSKQIIDDFLLNHVESIKKACDAKGWPLDYMKVVAIGGTSKLLSRELKMVFGDNVFIPDGSEYVNVLGFLSKSCAQDGIDITGLMGKKEVAA